MERETTDYVAQEESSDTRIIPDAAFILENIESGKRALFFLEMDMGTERIVSQITRDKRIYLFYKLIQYDRYLQWMRYRQTYAGFGDFRFFTLLFITIGEQRIENIRREMQRLPSLGKIIESLTGLSIKRFVRTICPVMSGIVTINGK